MKYSLSTSRRVRQAVLLLPLGLVVTACQHMPHPGGDASNGSELAQRFVKPVDGLVGIIVGRDGELTVVDRNGKVVPACSLPGVHPDDGKRSTAIDSDLPTCRGTTGTNILKVTPISVMNHTGSDCITISGVTFGRAWQRTVCP
ncbi:MAG: hypothetical protein R3E33_00885 [Rhodocyclaceae bacterium]|nr:hypothetical protein [Rhodocyclaceae bacterium]